MPLNNLNNKQLECKETVSKFPVLRVTIVAIIILLIGIGWYLYNSMYKRGGPIDNAGRAAPVAVELTTSPYKGNPMELFIWPGKLLLTFPPTRTAVANGWIDESELYGTPEFETKIIKDESSGDQTSEPDEVISSPDPEKQAPPPSEPAGEYVVQDPDSIKISELVNEETNTHYNNLYAIMMELNDYYDNTEDDLGSFPETLDVFPILQDTIYAPEGEEIYPYATSKDEFGKPTFELNVDLPEGFEKWEREDGGNNELIYEVGTDLTIID